MVTPRALFLGLIVAVSTAPAWAESPSDWGHDADAAIPCTTGAWFAIVPFATALHGHGASSKVPLPAYWKTSSAQVPPPADIGMDPTLAVSVIDADDTMVEGELGVGFVVPGVESPDPTGPAVLGRQLWWRPLQPLSPGEYRTTVVVQAPPGGGAPGCTHETFSRTFSFFVVDEPPPPPQLTLHSYLLDRAGDSTSYATGEDCSEDADVTYCADEPSVCCSRGRLVEFFAEATVSGTGSAVGSDYFLWMEHAQASPPGLISRHWEHPISDGALVTERFEYWEPAQFAQLEVDALCFEARLYRVSTGELMAEGEACTAVGDVVVEAKVPLVCLPEPCVELAGNLGPADDGPEVAQDAGPEPLPDTAAADMLADSGEDGPEVAQDTGPEPPPDASSADMLADKVGAEPLAGAGAGG
ncbi:MAG: hypothetical protein KC656_29450, partial [Myxococcales bacterium]|nr:hypothetical protein [Myxococcales bacterium]